MEYPVTFTLFLILSILILISMFTLSIRGQLLLFWAYLPFVDTLKRLVFLDASADPSNMYYLILTQDLLLLGILFKMILAVTSRPVRLRVRAVDIAVGLFVAYSVLSVFLSQGVPLSAQVAALGMRVWPLIAYYLAAAYLSDTKSGRRLAKLSIVVGVIVAIYGIRQFFFGVLPFEELWLNLAEGSSNVATLRSNANLGVFRTFGTMDSHSSYGLFLGTCLVLVWPLRSRLGLIPSLLLSMVLASGLILSFTRFTWLMPILAFGFIISFKYDRVRPFFQIHNLRKASLFLLLITSSFAIFYLAMSSLYGVRLVSAASNSYLRRALGTGTFEARLKVSNLIGNDTSTSLIGKGLASTGYFARKFEFSSSDINYHNIYVDMIDQMGIIGLGIFLILLYLVIRTALIRINAQANLKNREFLVSLFALFLAMMTVGHFNGAVFHFGRAIPFYFWAICGILTHFQISEDNDITSTDQSSQHDG
jgi:hypothetical protein